MVKNHKMLAALLAGAVVIGGLLTWMVLHNRIPPPSAEAVSLAKFVSTPEFESFSEERQRPYLQALEKSKAQLATAHESGKLSDREYEAALQGAWVGRIERQMEEYVALTDPAKRRRFLDKIINQRQVSHTSPADGKKSHSAILKEQLRTWPPDRREVWDQFRKAVQERRKARGLPPDPHMEITIAPQPK